MDLEEVGEVFPNVTSRMRMTKTKMRTMKTRRIKTRRKRKRKRKIITMNTDDLEREGPRRMVEKRRGQEEELAVGVKKGLVVEG